MVDELVMTQIGALQNCPWTIQKLHPATLDALEHVRIGEVDWSRARRILGYVDGTGGKDGDMYSPKVEAAWGMALLVEYADGHNNDMYHIAEDVSAFLMWTAEPKMMARQRLGLISVVMLLIV